MGPQPGTLLVSWTPVVTQPLPPSRAAVHSYLVYADGRNIAQVPNASGQFMLICISFISFVVNGGGGNGRTSVVTGHKPISACRCSYVSAKTM
uniref:Fibronectin type-III domain-containing protein n=1 Tax=Ascaris lumbricoides TaxID=6252 RepID=A0A0M3HLX9_ASCLU